MMPAKWWKRIPSVSRVADMLPISAVLSDDKTIITKDGTLCQVISVQGRDYSTLDGELQAALFSSRKHFFETQSPGIGISTHSFRFRLGRGLQADHHGDRLINLLAETHGKAFVDSLRTRHNIVVYTRAQNLEERVKALGGRGTNAWSNPKVRLDALNAAVDNMLLQLKQFRPELLRHGTVHSPLMGFWARLINGEHVNVNPNSRSHLDELLAGRGLFWPEAEPHVLQYLKDGHPKRLSTWFTIKAYPNKASGKLLEALFSLPHELSLHQNFEIYPREKAKAVCEDQGQHIGRFVQNAALFHEQLRELLPRIVAGEISLGQHSYALQVFGETIDELEQAALDVKDAIEARDLLVVKETTNAEPLFWSVFPDMTGFNKRKRDVTTENIADFCAFPSIGEGLDACSWGDEPVTLFKTVSGSDYAFTFHRSTRPQALGNTIVVGGSEAGKTTLISFLLSMCHKYPGFRALCFDSLHGMEVAIRMFGGSYTDFDEGAEINPFHVENTRANRLWLATVLQALSKKTDDASLETIASAIDQIYRLPMQDRSLSAGRVAFGVSSPGSVAEALSKWMDDGPYGHFIHGKTDALNFDRCWAGLDTTTLQDHPDVLGFFADYTIHRFTTTIMKDPGPHAIFFDELRRYLDHPVFGPRILSVYEQIRKMDGVVIAAIQEMAGLTKSEHAEDMIKSTSTFILFPDPGAKEEDYKVLDLTETELAWIKKPSIRQVLVKIRGGESTILNVDLTHIGKLLECFNSGNDEAARLRRLHAKGGNWRQAFIRGDKA